MIENVSQSFIKSYSDYKAGTECGLVIYEKYVNKNYPPPTKPMLKGIYFEYKATGSLPLDKKIPQPEYVYKGTPREALSADYQKIHESVELFKKMIKHYGIRIKSIGKKLTAKGMTGILDIEAEMNGRTIFIDLKYSSLINDKWDESGWQTESLPYKDKLMIQGVHYKILGKEAMGLENVPFYYWVFSAINPQDAKIILQEVDEDRFARHYEVVENVRNDFNETLAAGGLKPRPSFSKCQDCYLFQNCKYRAEVPLVETVYY